MGGNTSYANLNCKVNDYVNKNVNRPKFKSQKAIKINTSTYLKEVFYFLTKHTFLKNNSTVSLFSCFKATKGI